jgi:hypothetical protein
MRRKRNLTTNEITKHKARLNIHGGKQVPGINYFDTYAPVITWFAIRLLMAIAIMFDLAMRQVDFVQAYPEAPIEFDMYMELPLGIETMYSISFRTCMDKNKLVECGISTWLRSCKI